VIVIDDDDLVREAVCDLLRSIGLPTKPFASVPEFLKSKLPDGPSCLVLDVRLPGLSGLDFQSELNKSNIQIPIVFMTGHGQVSGPNPATGEGQIDYVWGSRAFRLNNVVISIIDDDELVRDAVRDLVRSLGYDAKAFASAEDYLRSDSLWASSCLITDLQMPGMGGAELQDRLIAEGNPTPIIFITAYFDEKVRSRVLKAGGCGFFKKPLDETAFVQCLEKALKPAA
jgi:FixJ family two-component response regulator